MFISKKELHDKLIEKTRALGRQVKFSEVDSDPTMPNPNDYAYHWGSFTDAATEAYREVFYGKPPKKIYANKPKSSETISKKSHGGMSPERKAEVLDEIVKMFIESGDRMPTTQMVKKNPRITEREVTILRKNGELHKWRIEKMAEIQKNDMETKSKGVDESVADEKIREERTTDDKTAGEIIEVEKISSENVAYEVETGTVEQLAAGTAREDETKSNQLTKYQRVVRDQDECFSLMESVCKELGYVPTQDDVRKSKKLPNWKTLLNKIGPWWNWDEMFNVPFANDRSRRMAEKQKAIERGETVVAERSRKEVKMKKESEVELKPEVAVETVVEPKTEPVTSSEPAVDQVDIVETPIVPIEMIEETLDTPEKVQVKSDMEFREIPIKLIVPKGAKGSVQISLSFEL